MFKDLPEKYYLAHAQEIFDFVGDHCAHLLSASEHRYLDSYRELEQDAQCLLIRLLSRKPRFIHIDSLRYSEIKDLAAAIQQTKALGFTSHVTDEDWSIFLANLTKQQLLDCLAAERVSAKPSNPKARLLELAQRHCVAAEQPQLRRQFVVRRQQAAVDYILFLYFGDLRNRLQKFAMRDLGVLRTRKNNTTPTPRFNTRAEALSAFKFQQLQRDFKAQPSQARDTAADYLLSTTAVGPSARQLKHKLLVDVGAQFSGEQPHRAIELWKSSEEPIATEKWVREAYAHQDKNVLKEELEQLRQQTLPPATQLFIDDFYTRKYQGKRTSIYTDLLRESPNQLSIDEVYTENVEQGVIEHYRRQGIRAYFTENKLWRALFAFTFWSLLFGRNRPAVNEFDTLPLSLRHGNFYQENQSAIEQSLDILDKPAEAIAQFTRLAAKHYGSPTGLFRWNSNLLDVLRPCIELSPTGCLAKVLREMAMNFKHCKDGYPDLMLIEDEHMRFEEVKAPGDSLRPNQLVSINRLREAGINVAISQVTWAVDPEQTYAVVDIETTGGRKSGNAITEIAVVKVRGKKVVGQWSSLINPKRRIPPHITHLTGISNEMVASAPLFAEIADALDAQLSDTIFVAHNVGFDYGFIKAAYESLGRRFRQPKLCTVRQARKAFPSLKSYSLGNLCEHFDIDLHNHHRALSDARATADLLVLIQEGAASK